LIHLHWHLDTPGGLDSQDQSRLRFLNLSGQTFKKCWDCLDCRDKFFLSRLRFLKIKTFQLRLCHVVIFDKILETNQDCQDLSRLRMWESYKRFVKTWIRFANPWIRTVSWVQILTSKRFDSYLTIRIPDSYRIVVHKSGLGNIFFVSYIRIKPIFKRFDLFSRIQRILTNPHES